MLDDFQMIFPDRQYSPVFGSVDSIGEGYYALISLEALDDFTSMSEVFTNDGLYFRILFPDANKMPLFAISSKYSIVAYLNIYVYICSYDGLL